MEERNIKDRGRSIDTIYNYMWNWLNVSKYDKYPKTLYDKYPKTLYFWYIIMNEANDDKKKEDYKKKGFDTLKFKSKLDENYQIKYDNLPNEEDTIFNNMIKPIVRTLDIYLMIMFIKELFYYSSKFDSTTIELVKKLENDAYKNEINSPESLIIKIQKIINSINDSIPITDTTTKK
jgi:hypothetical protein